MTKRQIATNFSVLFYIAGSVTTLPILPVIFYGLSLGYCIKALSEE